MQDPNTVLADDLNPTFKCGQKTWSKSEIDNLLEKLQIKSYLGGVQLISQLIQKKIFILPFSKKSEVASIEKINRVENSLFSIEGTESITRIVVKFEDANKFFEQLVEVCNNPLLNYNPDPSKQNSVPQIPESKTPLNFSQLPLQNPSNSVSSLPLQPASTLKFEKAFGSFINKKFEITSCMILKRPDNSGYDYSFTSPADARKFSTGILKYGLSGASQNEGKDFLAKGKYFIVNLTQDETIKLLADLSQETKAPKDLNPLGQIRFTQFCDNFKKKNLKSSIPEIKDFYSKANVDPINDHLLIMHIFEHVFQKVDTKLEKGTGQRDLYLMWLDKNLTSILSDFLNTNKDINTPEFSKVKAFIAKSKLAKYYNDNIMREKKNECEKLIAQHEDSQTPRPVFTKNSMPFPAFPSSNVPQTLEKSKTVGFPLTPLLDFETVQSKQAFAILMKQRFKTKENCMILTKPGSSDFHCSFKNEEGAKKLISGITDYGLSNKNIKKEIQSGSTISFFDTCFFELSLTKEECNNLYSKLSSEMKIPQDLNLVDQERFIIFCDNFEQKKLNRQDSKAPKTEEFFKRAKVDPAKDHLLIMYILESTLGTIGKEFSKDSTVYITYRSWVNATRKDIVTQFVSSNKDSDALDKIQKFVHRNDLIHFDVINECRELLKNPPTNTIRPS